MGAALGRRAAYSVSPWEWSDLRPFLEDWVYGTETPPMPGHPDWTVNPVEEGAQALRAPGRAARPTP